MRLSKLRLVGFKSFVDSSEVLIEPGLTAIVGPNGCGKSNLVEALRWVMGESSYKSLRASGMDDVIFSGSVNRPGRNSAEVTLFIDNSRRMAPAQFNNADALEVTRRIEREAGSVYRINGRDVRARDVQLLFADASTGAHSPALVRQGQIGEIISAKPRDRRRILEEAAGISGLHGRRHEAELRLRAAEQNIARIDDVIAQLAGQLDSLKRQARQAARYRTLSAEIRKTEAILWHLRRLAAVEAVSEQETVVAQAVAEVETLSREAAAASTARTDAAAGLPALREAEAECAARLRHLTVTRDGLDKEKEQALARARELAERYEQIADDLTRERDGLSETAAMIARLDGEAAELRTADSGAAAKRETLDQRLAAATAELEAAEAALAEANSVMAERAARQRSLEKAQSEARARLTRLSEQLTGIEAETTALVDGDAAPPIEALQHDVAEARSAAETAETESSEADAALAEARSQQETAREPVVAAERDIKALQAEQVTLAKVLAVDEDASWPPLLDQVGVSPGYEAALGAAFGDELDRPSDADAPAHWRLIAAAPDDPPLPEGARPLAEVVRAPDVLARRLAQTGLVPAADGARLQPMLRPGQRLVSQAGDLWRWDGFTAAADAPTAAARRLAQRNRLDEVGREIAAATDKLADYRRQAADAEAAVKTAAERAEAARQGVRAARAAASAAADRLAEAERKAAQQASRLSALAEAKAQIEASLAEAHRAYSEAESGLAELGSDPAIASRIEDLKSRVAEHRSQVADARAEHDAHEREAARRADRLKRIAEERQGWSKRDGDARAQIEKLEGRASEISSEAETLADIPAALDERRARIADEIEAAEAARRSAADALAAGETRQAEAEKAGKAADEALSRARERRAREDATFDGLRQRLADLEETIQDALDRPGSEALAAAGLSADAALPPAERLEADLDRFKRERERLGSVNLRAEEEMREVRERHDELATERADLEGAIGRLRSAIQSLNREGRERLLGAFETVNRHFEELFVRLFGGGAAELKLTESDDPLEAGLEIYARPPGKRLQVLTLLSGGEQTLTAIALIFAVFLTNPSPICVLDEVDAPLDDANVERFCDLLEEMARTTDTRFMLITHNPITMSRVDRLFGVTMAERGVSQLVSVDIQEAVTMSETSPVQASA